MPMKYIATTSYLDENAVKLYHIWSIGGEVEALLLGVRVSEGNGLYRERGEGV